MHDLVVLQSYNCIYEGVCHHVLNLAIDTWIHDTNVFVCDITHWHFFPTMAYIVSILLLRLLFAICAFGLCQVFGVGNYHLLDWISHVKVCLQIKYLVPNSLLLSNLGKAIKMLSSIWCSSWELDHATCVIEAREMIESRLPTNNRLNHKVNTNNINFKKTLGLRFVHLLLL